RDRRPGSTRLRRAARRSTPPWTSRWRRDVDDHSRAFAREVASGAEHRRSGKVASRGRLNGPRDLNEARGCADVTDARGGQPLREVLHANTKQTRERQHLLLCGVVSTVGVGEAEPNILKLEPGVRQRLPNGLGETVTTHR